MFEMRASHSRNVWRECCSPKTMRALKKHGTAGARTVGFRDHIKKEVRGTEWCGPYCDFPDLAVLDVAMKSAPARDCGKCDFNRKSAPHHSRIHGTGVPLRGPLTRIT